MEENKKPKNLVYLKFTLLFGILNVIRKILNQFVIDLDFLCLIVVAFFGHAHDVGVASIRFCFVSFRIKIRIRSPPIRWTNFWDGLFMCNFKSTNMSCSCNSKNGSALDSPLVDDKQENFNFCIRRFSIVLFLSNGGFLISCLWAQN